MVVPRCSYGQGSIGAASGTILDVLKTSKMKENERFYGFTDFRGPAAHRGRDSHAPSNQIAAAVGALVPPSSTALATKASLSL